MQEIELKFLVPESRLKSLIEEVKGLSSQEMQMAAHYFDTPDETLAKAGVGLRIRCEGSTWVQTIKAGGDGMAARLEHNKVLDDQQVQQMLDSNRLTPDMSLYSGIDSDSDSDSGDISVASALAHLDIDEIANSLSRQYVTDVKRITCQLRSNDDKSVIEVAYDYGYIIHGIQDSHRQVIQEIEFELLSGDVDYLFEVAKSWCKRYKLCLSTVTKAERGGLLVKGKHHSSARKANLDKLEVDKNTSLPAFVRACVHNCLLQILPNSSAIVAGSQDSAHVRELHTGIQRLISALKAFKHFSDEINPDWLPILKQTAVILDDYYKVAHIAVAVEAKMQQRGAPEANWQAVLEHVAIAPINALRANDFQITLLELVAYVMSDTEQESEDLRAIKAVSKIKKVLSKQYKKLKKAERRTKKAYANATEKQSATATSSAMNQGNLDESNLDEGNVDEGNLDQDNLAHAYYKLNKHLTRMRYVSEFAAPLYAKKKTKRWLKRLIKAQKAWTRYMKHRHYQDAYDAHAAIDSAAWYGAGWFAATLKRDRKRYKKHLKKLHKRANFWG